VSVCLLSASALDFDWRPLGPGRSPAAARGVTLWGGGFGILGGVAALEGGVDALLA
jgi:hypothetical protein